MFQINITDLTVFLGGQYLLDHIHLNIQAEEVWAIVGNSGSGKSTLAKALCKQIFHRGEIVFKNSEGKNIEPRIQLVEQQHLFRNKSNVSQFYYQQRFNSSDAEDTHDVITELGDTEQDKLLAWINIFGLGEFLHKPLIQLSNGENKRLQLAKAMKGDPELLILDNPYIGLDKEGRNKLDHALSELRSMGKQFILISAVDELPDIVTHVAILEKGKVQTVLSHVEFKKMKHPKDPVLLENIPFNFPKSKDSEVLEIVEMKNVSIQYNDLSILKNINWKVSKGERWCVTGHNGSGKSTLLSLISADNPQAYANDIYLFGKKRGTGESIWDIKKNMGYVSPELHLFFEKSETVFNAVASGLYDTIGLFRYVPEADRKTVENWLSIIGIENLKDKRLHQLSLGEQRTVMLTRALVKSPPLLILDEPCQGLDKFQTQRFKAIVDAICASSSTTLIYVSHYEHDVPSCINRYLVLEKGKIISLI
jgi:molybdate transport system ATP-binding protein